MARRPTRSTKAKEPAVNPNQEDFFNRSDRPPPDVFEVLSSRTGHTRARVIEEYTERAGIREHVGGMSRCEAEIKAIGDVEDVLRRHR